MSIMKLLGLTRDRDTAGDGAAGTSTDTVRKIVDALNDLPAERATQIGAFAYILGRVAHADMKISAAETLAMERIVVEHGKLPQEQAILVVQMARSQNMLFGGTENYLVTREYNRVADRGQKLALLDCLYAVSSADHEISGAEDQAIRQIADELLLDRADFIEVRGRYREHLSVLKKPDDTED